MYEKIIATKLSFGVTVTYKRKKKIHQQHRDRSALGINTACLKLLTEVPKIKRGRDFIATH